MAGNLTDREGWGLHECQQKTRLALIERDYTQMAKQISEMHEAIVGNGKPGLKTDMELQKTDTGRLWKAFYGLAGIVGTAVLFFGGYLIRG